MKKVVQMFKEIEFYDLERYPDNYQGVMQGDAYWSPAPIAILGYYGRFWSLHHYREFDMDRPRCYNCGRYVKKGDWWKGKLTGPCTICDDLLPN